jgi:hypothetical protein
MAVKKTPGPIMQKVRARVTRTKAEAKAATAGAATAVKKQVSGVRNAARAISDTRKAKVEAKKTGKKDNTLAYNVGEAFQTGKSKVFDSGRPNAAVGRARIKSARQKKQGVTWNKDGQQYQLSPKKRTAVKEIISTYSDNTIEKHTPRQLKKMAREDYKIQKNKPTTDAQMRKQNAKKQRRAAGCIPSGVGTNACRGDLMGTGGYKKK